MTPRTLLMIACCLSLTAAAQDVCEVARPLNGQRLLRRLSLDLRNMVPTLAEQETQKGLTAVPAAVVDQFLASPDFGLVMRSYHQALLWPNLDQVNLDPLAQVLTPVELAPGVTVYYSVVRALTMRTITKPFPPCRNAPATWDANGKLVTTPLIENGQTVAVQEGWVNVAPYWAPSTTIKVCGFDAQPALTAAACNPADTARSPYMKQFCDQFESYAAVGGFPLINTPTSCESGIAFIAGGCGCGPNLRLCQTVETAAEVRAALIEQQLRMVDHVAKDDAPYTDLLLSPAASINGPLAHYLTWQSRTSFDVFGETDATSPIPANLPFSNKAWQPITRTGRHSGVLTTPGYLLKFQSNRGRAHRFYNAFECSAFIPSGALPSPTEACSKHEDLTQRCGCNACHVKLEPMAAGWGRFAEYGATPLSEARYPKTYDTICTNFTDMDQLLRCVRFYQTEAVGDELPFKGLLRPYVFLPPQQVARLEVGPRAVVQDAIDSGALANCTTRRMWSYFMRRDPRPDEELTIIQPLAADFKANGYRLKPLVRAIVTHPAYGRMP